MLTDNRLALPSIRPFVGARVCAMACVIALVSAPVGVRVCARRGCLRVRERAFVCSHMSNLPKLHRDTSADQKFESQKHLRTTWHGISENCQMAKRIIDSMTRFVICRKCLPQLRSRFALYDLGVEGVERAYKVLLHTTAT